MSFTLAQILGDPPDPARWWCDGKARHASEGLARAAVRSLERRGLNRPEDGVLQVYKCPTCLTWHTGHKRPEET